MCCGIVPMTGLEACTCFHSENIFCDFNHLATCAKVLGVPEPITVDCLLGAMLVMLHHACSAFFARCLLLCFVCALLAAFSPNLHVNKPVYQSIGHPKYWKITLAKMERVIYMLHVLQIEKTFANFLVFRKPCIVF